MASRYKRRQKRSPLLGLLALALCLVAGGVAWVGRGPSVQPAQAAPMPEGSAKVYFLDIGQGDSELILLPGGKTVLIDAGPKDSEDALCARLNELGVQTIDWLVASHPHADHIGGMAKVINSFDVGQVYMPRIDDAQTPTTSTYEKLLEAIAEKGLQISTAKAGVTLFEENGCKLEFLAPVGGEHDGLNNWSAVAMLTVGERKFLFTGDIEKEAEKQILNAGQSLHADVLKCAHHGSNTSTTAAFLKAVAPTAAVISCRDENSYNHPHQGTLDKFGIAGVQVYRTDLQGEIVAECDGKNIKVTSGG